MNRIYCVFSRVFFYVKILVILGYYLVKGLNIIIIYKNDSILKLLLLFDDKEIKLLYYGLVFIGFRFYVFCGVKRNDGYYLFL